MLLEEYLSDELNVASNVEANSQDDEGCTLLHCTLNCGLENLMLCSYC